MAVPYTNVDALSNLVQDAYDQYVRLALRSAPQFRAIADTKPVAQTQPGSTVVFQIHQNLAPVTAPLTDDVTDPAGVSLNNTVTVPVTVNEYGTYTVVTKALREFALDNNLDTNVADTIAYNMADSVDGIVEGVLAGASNVVRVVSGITVTTGDADDITGNDTIKASTIRYAVTKLRAASVPTVDGSNYVAFIHPSVANDLRVEMGPAAWRAPHEYVDTKELYAGEIGIFEGVRFIETPRVGVNTNAGTVEVYNTYILGKEALAEVVSDEFHVVVNGNVVDPLDRKTAIGWTGIAGWSLFRPESLWKIETAAAIN